MTKNIKNPTILAAFVLLVTGIVICAIFLVSIKASAPVNTSSAVHTKANQQQSNSGQQEQKNSNSNQNPDSTNATTPNPSPTTTPAQSSTSGSNIIISNTAFSPTASTVKKGVSVTWTNKDSGNHAIAEDDTDNTSQNSQTFHSPQLKPGESYTYAFTKSGTYHYKDVINSALTGTITVID